MANNTSEQKSERSKLLGVQRSLLRSLSGSYSEDDTNKNKSRAWEKMFSDKHDLEYDSVSEESYSGGESSNGDQPSVSGAIESDGIDKHPDQRTLGTFAGVFAPVTLSMCSTMVFLRMGYVVGNAGLWGSLLMMLIAFTILICTVFSLSAIATNGAVEGGGVYFMISRTLGNKMLCV